MANPLKKFDPEEQHPQVTTTQRVFDDGYEAPYSYEPSDDELEGMARRAEYDQHIRNIYRWNQ